MGKLDAEVEVAEKRPRNPVAPDGHGLYARLGGSAGPVGFSVEGKRYRNFGFLHHQPPTLVRTHESVLLNRKPTFSSPMMNAASRPRW